jgi:hypothetical protein
MPAGTRLAALSHPGNDILKLENDIVSPVSNISRGPRDSANAVIDRYTVGSIPSESAIPESNPPQIRSTSATQISSAHTTHTNYSVPRIPRSNTEIVFSNGL